MARKRALAQSKIPVAPTVKRMADFPIDPPKLEIGAKYGHIRDGQIYLSAGLTRYMEERWGVFTAVVTSTNTSDSTVTVFRADPSRGEPVPVNRYGAMNSAVFNFFVPLQKLNLNPGKDRQFEVLPMEQPMEDGPVAFVFNMAQRVSIPRNRKDEEAEAAAKGKSDPNPDSAEDESDAKEEMGAHDSVGAHLHD